MTEKSTGQQSGEKQPLEQEPQPRRPSIRGAWKYDVLRKAEAEARAINYAAAEQSIQKRLFTMTITATHKEGESMDDEQNEKQFMIDLVFKPDGTGLKFRPEETQLLLAHISEILKAVEEEEKLIMEEQST